MKKSNFWSGLVYALLGLAFLLAGLMWETRLSSLCVGFGAGMLSSGAVQLVRYRKWTRPENRDAYQERLEAEQIELRDERKEMLRNKSGRYAYVFNLLVNCLALFVLASLDALKIVEIENLIILGLALWLLAQYFAGIVFYKILEKKY